MHRSEDENPHWIDIPKFSDERGSLSVIESSDQVPFDINRVYYIYEVSPEVVRGRHAHRELEQIMIALNGSLDLLLETGAGQREFQLDSPTDGVYIPKQTWRVLSNFCPETVCLVLASHQYNPEDYINDYEKFQEEVTSTVR
jgi:dTDP-4-dehydrorhamnose 3,5-epimerase-like enzyme